MIYIKHFVLMVFAFICLVGIFTEINAATLQERYDDKGIIPILQTYLEQGTPIYTIVKDCLTIDGLNPQNLIKELYCLGVKGSDIESAADKNGISEIIFIAGYKKSVEECEDAVVDTQAYTPTNNTISFRGLSSPSASGVSASPYTF